MDSDEETSSPKRSKCISDGNIQESKEAGVDTAILYEQNKHLTVRELQKTMEQKFDIHWSESRIREIRNSV